LAEGDSVLSGDASASSGGFVASCFVRVHVDMPDYCVSCVIRGICGEGEICRFLWCRRCGYKLYFVNVLLGWVACSACGFMNRHRRFRKLVNLESF
jgi:ribosomal protein L37E